MKVQAEFSLHPGISFKGKRYSANHDSASPQQFNSTSQLLSRLRAARPNAGFPTWPTQKQSEQNNRAEKQHSKSAKNSKLDPVLAALSSQLVLGNKRSESLHVAVTLPGRCVCVCWAKGPLYLQLNAKFVQRGANKSRSRRSLHFKVQPKGRNCKVRHQQPQEITNRFKEWKNWVTPCSNPHVRHSFWQELCCAFWNIGQLPEVKDELDKGGEDLLYTIYMDLSSTRGETFITERDYADCFCL